MTWTCRMSDTKEKPWRGVAWIRVSAGMCTKHGTPVGTLTKLCITCHHEQLEAARNGSREWEL
jgi:hypothetical protein